MAKTGKNNHLQVEELIRQAIAACSYDNSFQEIKLYLIAALNRTSQVSKKRMRRQAEANKTHKTWWEMLKENAAKNAKKNAKFDLKEGEELNDIGTNDRNNE